MNINFSKISKMLYLIIYISLKTTDERKINAIFCLIDILLIIYYNKFIIDLNLYNNYKLYYLYIINNIIKIYIDNFYIHKFIKIKN